MMIPELLRLLDYRFGRAFLELPALALTFELHLDAQFLQAQISSIATTCTYIHDDVHDDVDDDDDEAEGDNDDDDDGDGGDEDDDDEDDDDDEED